MDMVRSYVWRVAEASRRLGKIWREFLYWIGWLRRPRKWEYYYENGRLRAREIPQRP